MKKKKNLTASYQSQGLKSKRKQIRITKQQKHVMKKKHVNF